MSTALLEVDGLRVSYRTRHQSVTAVHDVSFAVEPGQVVALVGESGSGKSTIAHTVLGLLPRGGRVEGGHVWFSGTDLTRLRGRQMQALRGRQIALVPQDPTMSLNPVKRVGDQVSEVLRRHGLAGPRTAWARTLELFDQAGIPDPEVRARQYPHQLSGGLRQRALIAAAIAGNPRLIVADEPTSALDVTVQRVILDQLERLVRDLGTALLLITHDLAVASDRAQRIVVTSGGRVAEQGPAAQVFEHPATSYTRRLIASIPGSRPVPPAAVPPGTVPLITAEHLRKVYGSAPRDAQGKRRAAVDDVSLTIARGQTLGLVGESGSGKSTTARLVLSIIAPDEGRVLFDGDDVTAMRGNRLRAFRRRAQMVYQNPYSSLDPHWTVGQIVAEPLRVFAVGDRRSRRAAVAGLLDRVAMPAGVIDRRPAELSGGQRQRVAIARALALGPDLVVCDEPVSALDVTVQSQVLALLRELQQQTGVSYLFITHDLAVVRDVAHVVGVMEGGRIVEMAPTSALFAGPAHPYSRQLFAAIPGRARPGGARTEDGEVSA